MTPKERADTLLLKYINTVIDFPYIDSEGDQCVGTGYMTHRSAIKCTLKAVDEVLALMIGTLKWDKESNGNIQYWEEVKEIITEKL